MTIPLTDAEYARLSRPVNLPRERWGGFQHLISRLQSGIGRVGSGWTLTLSAADARALLNYASPSYGPGTYQEQLRPIAPKVQAALDAEGATETGSLFGAML